MNGTDTLARLRAEIPSAGLFAEKDWLLSPEPLRLGADVVKELDKLGHRLMIFQRASNELYHRRTSMLLEDGKNVLIPGEKFTYLTFKETPEAIAKLIEDLMMHQPVKQ